MIIGNKMKREKIKLTPIKLTLIITLIMLGFYHFFGENFKFLQILELKMLDMRFNIRGDRSPDNNVVIVAVDDASIKTIGRWPWGRSIHAELISLLKADGAKAIGFDILFSEPQKTATTSNLQRLYQYYMSLPIAEQEPYGKDFADHIAIAVRNADHDARLAEEIKKRGNIVMPITFQGFNNTDEYFPDSSEILKEDEAADNNDDNDEPPAELLEQLAFSSLGEDVSVPDEVRANAFQCVIQNEMTEVFDIPVGERLLLPLSSYYRNAKYLGFPNYFLDIDGSARWSNMVIGHKEMFYPSFAVQLLKIFKDLNNDDIKLIQGKGILFGNQMIPLDKKGRLLINYYGPSEAVQYYPYISVIDKKLPPGTFKDKIVLVGYAATGLVDALTTPFSDSMPGVEKHATVISNILQDDFLYRNTSSYFTDLIYIIFTGLFAGIAVLRFSALKGAWVSLLIFSILLISNYFVFSYLKTWINIVYPVLTLFIVSGSLILFKFFTEEKDKLFLKAIFGNYLTPDLIEEMCKNRIMPRLGGEARFITAYFTDIECFSRLSEKLTPEQLVELLNEYFSAMTDILINEKGTLDKYEGDAMVAFFVHRQMFLIML